MKVHTGLVRISNNSNARQHFFLASTEMSRLSTEAVWASGEQVRRASDVQPSIIRQERQAVDKIKAAILSHGNYLLLKAASCIISSQMYMYHKSMFHRSWMLMKFARSFMKIMLLSESMETLTSQKAEQQNVHVWQQEANSKDP